MAAIDFEDSPTCPVKPEPCRLETEMTTLLQFNWGSTLLRTLQAMREANDQCDIVLTTSSGSSLNAHSALLCAASPRLRAEWKESCSQIDLGDISIDTVKVILDFIYLGQAEVPTNELGAVQQFAEQFEIEQLVEVCERVSQEKTGVTVSVTDPEENEGSKESSQKRNKRVKKEPVVRKVKIETQAAEEEAEEEDVSAAAADDDDDDGDMGLDEALAVKAESDEEYEATRPRPRTRRRTKTTTARKKLAQKANLKRGSVVKKPGSWFCEKCGRKFKFNEGLRKHLSTHKDDDRCRCYLCDEEFDDNDNFQAHLKGHQITAGTFKCAVCDVVVGKKSALRSHVTKVHGQKKKEHKCQLCGNIFPTKTALTIHRQEHAGQKRYQCQYCAREFYWQSNLKEHMRVHTGEKPFACSHCDKKFTHNTNRKVHQRWHHTHEKLPLCGDKICNDTRGLETRKKPRLIHKCQMCSKEFSRRDSFTKHMHRHNGTFAFCCDYCGKGFMEKECFDTHIKGHQGIASSFQCTVCKLVVTTKKGLQKHMRTMHDRDKQYQCTVCGVTFVHRSSFVAHAMIHSGQKPYRCEECDRTFRCSSHLKGHLRIHTGEKPYSCSFCTSKFAHNNSRKAHEKQHHPDKVSGPPNVRRVPSTATGGRKRKAEQILQRENQSNPPNLQPETQTIAEIAEDPHTQQVVTDWDTAGMYIVREGMAEHVPLSRMQGRERQYAIDESQGLLTGQVLGGSSEMTYTMWSSNGTVAYPSRSEN